MRAHACPWQGEQAPLNRDDVASGLSTLLSGSSLGLPELHTLLDEVWGRVHGDAGRSAARAELVQLFSTRSPEALPTVDGLLAANEQDLDYY